VLRSGAGGGLMGLIEQAVAAPTRLHFVPSGVSVGVGELWADAAKAASWLQGRVGPDAPVAMVLDSSPASVASLLGAWRAGRRVVSVPLPPRAASIDWYQACIEGVCRACGAEMLLVAGELIPRLPPTAVKVASFEGAVEGAPGGFAERPDAGELVQFTSGSTFGSQRGRARYGRARGERGRHPRGDRDPAGGRRLLVAAAVACTTFASTIIAVPDFGFGLAVRRGSPTALGLGRLRVCITGKEPVRTATLDAFAATFAPAGFDPVAFCPAYGLAEAGLAVTMTRPGVAWSSIEVDPDGLAEGAVRPAPGGLALVSCGPPLPGYQVRVGGGRAGTVAVGGPSLYQRYLPGEVRAGAWLVTSDLGVVHDGELYVAGRIDDVVLLGGRNVYLTDLDAVVGDRVGARAGRVQAVAVDGGFAIVAEADGGARRRRRCGGRWATGDPRGEGIRQVKGNGAMSEAMAVRPGADHHEGTT
jgi:acyl-CoA synthetase (AMP-forming)/AMP-acid ligase II